MQEIWLGLQYCKTRWFFFLQQQLGIVPLALAKSINAQTVIEGIETQQQLELMQTVGFDMYQGYFLAMPTPIELDVQIAI